MRSTRSIYNLGMYVENSGLFTVMLTQCRPYTWQNPVKKKKKEEDLSVLSEPTSGILHFTIVSLFSFDRFTLLQLQLPNEKFLARDRRNSPSAAQTALWLKKKKEKKKLIELG